MNGVASALLDTGLGPPAKFRRHKVYVFLEEETVNWAPPGRPTRTRYNGESLLSLTLRFRRHSHDTRLRSAGYRLTTRLKESREGVPRVGGLSGESYELTPQGNL